MPGHSEIYITTGPGNHRLDGSKAYHALTIRLAPSTGQTKLKMADHYVEAFTTAGSTLVLMRFADAVSELEGADGLRVHRSYWAPVLT